VLSTLAAALRLASIVLCLIVGVSFALFVIHQTSDASAHQQHVVNSPDEEPHSLSSTSTREEKASPRKTIDEAAEAVTSPFSGITESWKSEWAKRGVLLLLTLVIYGFGLSFIARVMRVRA
jgi:hypothetical protein